MYWIDYDYNLFLSSLGKLYTWKQNTNLLNLPPLCKLQPQLCYTLVTKLDKISDIGENIIFKYKEKEMVKVISLKCQHPFVKFVS